MTLDQYLTQATISDVDFARQIEVSPSTVHRLRRGQIPSRELMQVIFVKTGGKVRADDFFGIGA